MLCCYVHLLVTTHARNYQSVGQSEGAYWGLFCAEKKSLCVLVRASWVATYGGKVWKQLSKWILLPDYVPYIYTHPRNSHNKTNTKGSMPIEYNQTCTQPMNTKGNPLPGSVVCCVHFHSVYSTWVEWKMTPKPTSIGEGEIKAITQRARYTCAPWQISGWAWLHQGDTIHLLSH